LKTYDVVTEARRRLESEYQASDLSVLGQQWFKAIHEASKKDRESLRQKGREALELAKLRHDELRSRKGMSDDQLLDWLKEKPNFDGVFPESADLDERSRQKLVDDWEKTVPAVREWNERVAYSRVDYRRIAMELVALTALCAAGFVLTIRKSR
jgi:hypothetical protein